MRRSILKLLAAMSAVLTLPAALSQAQQWRPDDRSWELLGRIEQNPRVERSVIEIGRREGRFDSIGIAVENGDAEILDLKVIYGNGQTEDIRVRENFRAGSRSRPIDVRGRDRFIRQIEVTYRPLGPVKISVYGQQRRQRWEELGCARIGFLDDNDVIRIGRREGVFRAIKLKVENQSVRLRSLRVVYEGGERDEVNVSSIIPAGAETRPLDLPGRRRAIERVELRYLPQITLGSQRANVCVLGLQ